MNFFDKKLISKKEIILFLSVIFLSILFLKQYLKIQKKSNSIQVGEIGKITHQANNTQYRAFKKLDWDQSQKDQKIFQGDSVLTGENSNLVVDMNKGESIVVGENSLIVFSNLDNRSMADLKNGNFNLKVNGKIEIAINGKITEINGQNSNIQVYFDQKNKQPKLKLLSGNAQVKNEKKQFADLKRNLIIPLENFQAQSRKLAQQVEIPQLSLKSNSLNYIWKLYDLFEVDSHFNLTQKKYQPLQVTSDFDLVWGASDKLGSIEHAQDARFSQSVKKYKVDQLNFKLKKVFIGANYVRASNDFVNWSSTQKFSVNAGFLLGAEPTPYVQVEKLPLLDDKTAVITKVQLKNTMSQKLGYLVEASQNSQFTLGTTRFFWSTSDLIDLSFTQVGEYYYRFKLVSLKSELSSWSRPIRFEVYKQTPPEAPKLAYLKRSGYVQEQFKINWNSSGIRTYVEIQDENRKKVKSFLSDQVVWSPEKSGHYRVLAKTVNIYGQESKSSPAYEFIVKDKDVVQFNNNTFVQNEKQKDSQNEIRNENKRQVAATENSSLMQQKENSPQVENLTLLNRPTWALGGFLRTSQSSQQYYLNEPSQKYVGLYLRCLYFDKNHRGYTVDLKSSNNSNEGNSNVSTSFKELEARYHYTFGTRFIKSIGFELNAFTGLSFYRNSGQVYSNSYDLIKFGTSVVVGYTDRTYLLGEISFGAGIEQSYNTNINLGLNYSFNSKWSLMLNYGINIFEAGSNQSSATGTLPYREGFTEEKATLNYHF